MADYPITVGPGAPSWIFTPTTVAANTLKVTNIGSSPLYVGPLAALSTPGAYPPPVLPGRELYYTAATAATYLSAGFSAGTTSTTLSSNATAGSSAFTVGSTTGFTAGSVLLVGSAASSQEVVVVAGTTATAVTASTVTLYDHLSGVTVSTATGKWGQGRILTGVI